MDNTQKIIFGLSIPLVLIGGYWFVYRNREPILNLKDVDWLDNIAIIKFGNNKISAPLGTKNVINAGSTFSDKYKLEYISKGKIMEFYVKDKEGNLYDKQTLDFGAKIRY